MKNYYQLFTSMTELTSLGDIYQISQLPLQLQMAQILITELFLKMFPCLN